VDDEILIPDNKKVVANLVLSVNDQKMTFREVGTREELIFMAANIQLAVLDIANTLNTNNCNVTLTEAHADHWYPDDAA
jgi:hypothetical protein